MANPHLIATGVVYLSNATVPTPFFIDTDGFKIAKMNLGPKDFFARNSRQSNQLKGSGHVIFANLLVSPSSASCSANFALNQQGLTLTVEHTGTIGEFSNAHFSDLKVVFEQDADGPLKVSEANLNMTLMESTLRLEGKLDRKGFHFQLVQKPQTLELPPIGTATLSKVDVNTNVQRWEKLILLYNFSESLKDIVFDNATAAPRLHLNVANVSRIAGGGIKLIKKSKAVSVPFFQRIPGEMHESKAFTFELWITPTASGRNKSGTILSMGNPKGRSSENYLDISQNGAGNILVNGTYTTTIGAFEGPSILTGNLCHLVFTHDESGAEKLYVNGSLLAARSVNGEVQPGEEGLLLTLGNATKEDNAWLGEYHGLAIHTRAMTEEEIASIDQPSVEIEGMFSIANAPEPLDIMLPAKLELLQPQPRISIDIDDREFAIRPELKIGNIHLQWRGFGNNQWQLAGEAVASFWESKVPMLVGQGRGSTTKFATVSNDPRLELIQKESPVEIQLDKLGAVEFTQITLKVSRRSESKWELRSTGDQEFVILPAIRFRAFDLFADMLVETPQLSLTTAHLVLSGKWLEETTALHASRTTGDFRMLAEISFPMIFDLVIPTILDPQTGEVLNDGAQLNQQLLNVDLGLEVSQNGLMTKVNSNFSWIDQEAVQQQTEIPEFTLFTPPPNKNSILGYINNNIQSSIHELFSETGKQAAEYYLAIGTDQPRIYLNSKDSEPETMETITPMILPVAADIGGASSIFWLNQTADECKLIINIKNKSALEIDEAYLAFINDLANQEDVSVAGIQLVQRRIAERLPLSYDRLLAYYYGWNKAKGYIDLHSGMRLRIDFQNYQFVQASDQSAERGFTGSGSTFVELGTYTRKLNDGSYEQCLGFDPFLSQLETEGSVDIASRGAGGIFDLLKTENRKAIYRLFLPLNPSTGLGSERVATIIGTDSIADMIQVTDKFDADANILPDTGASFFFRGKAVITPEIQVFVRDQAIRVPVGTTVRQLIQRFDDIPQAGIGTQDLSNFLKIGKPLRLVHEGVNSTPAYRFVNIQNAQAVNQMDALDLPLVKGDRFYF
ncbi:LamG domain-containing protein [Lewinella cohaerens]|uniref:LamG domain-containing protein n=1 Tax=Lewinella cohaerens TaxID=70995 RepID=UPI000361D9C9|nr:LamG domain-containing protein [Lewinella cohaerens]